MAKKGKIVLVGVIAIAFMALPYIAPILQPFLDPYHGVAGAGLAASPPSGEHDILVVGNATVVWDEHGVPHIYASTDEAGVYAMGWVTASMRLFQMDLLRRIGEGNLSALVGEPGYDNDVFIRSIGLNHVLEETWKQIVEKPELQRLEDLLLAYSAGVNSYIDYAVENNLLPVEYRVLGLKPVHWKPVDTLSIARVIALGLAWNDEDLVLGKLVEKWGPRIIAYMDIPYWRGTSVQAECSYATEWGQVSSKPNAYDYSSRKMLSTVPVDKYTLPDVDPVLKWIDEVRGLWSIATMGLASNNWVVNGSVSENGKPLLANDPHLQLSVPPIWFLAEINTPSFKSIGALFPGTPLVVIGRNQHVAWAFTNVMGDFTDYYYYVWNGDKYYYRGEWLDADKSSETILVYNPIKRTYEKREITVLRTVHGPVLERDDTRYAVAWTGLDVSFELEFFVELNNASSVKEAITAQRWFHVPIQNLVVADDQGNFAYSPVGAYPVRDNLPVLLDDVVVAGVNMGELMNKGYIPFNGSRGEGEWTGYMPKEELPILYNPPIPFIATANSKPFDGSCGDFIGWHYADRYREERIKELLTEALADGVVTIDELKSIQTDHYDLSVEDYLETAILPYASGEYAEILKAWLATEGPNMDKDEFQPAIAVAWIYSFHKNVWKHLYGEEKDLGFLRFHYLLSIVKAAAEGDEYALSLIPGGDLKSLAEASLNDTVKLLSGYFGTSDYHQWRYGDIHYYLVEHPAFQVLDYKRIPANGGPYSINVARPTVVDTGQGMPVTHGPSIRQIVDLSNRGYMISLPGGESGNPFSKHYQDLYLYYWSQGKYLYYDLGSRPNAYHGPSLVFNRKG
ncbi:MAG: penicillin acylase family protein [Desulfurococcales archaeon]|nr:penicillin acylase family protein [Desulfurococcales archaeon]